MCCQCWCAKPIDFVTRIKVMSLLLLAQESSHGIVRPGTPASVDIVKARERNVERAFRWEQYGVAAFDRARREKKPILLMGAASWCHWCHVMDETTYLDPRIGRLLAEHFIVIRVDIDERPDIAERYGDWGWPATILLSPEAEEIGKYRGYINAQEFAPILESVVAQPNGKSAITAIEGATLKSAFVESLPWIAGYTLVKLDDWYDSAQGSWGFHQKVPIGDNILVELRRATHGNAAALARAVFTLEKQRVMIDPVWGGVYQYSAAAHWNEPHYEKLMPHQAFNIEAYAGAYAQTGRKDFLEDARRIARYLTTLLSSPEGAFYTSQDADVGSHDEKARFVDGDVYYRLGDSERRKLGMPRIDENVYAYENGLAITALCALHEASPDADVLARAVRAAEFIVKGHLDENGMFRHDAKSSSKVRYLADSAAFGLAMMHLHRVTNDVVWRERAEKTAKALEERLLDPATGALWAHTDDTAAVGVFARRQRPFVGNVLAARLCAALGGEFRARAGRILAAISTPRTVVDQGRMIGEYILALDDAGMIAWDKAN